MTNNIEEIRYQVGEAWKGGYNPSTMYGIAWVVQDPEGLSVYRSKKSGNIGHPLSDTEWWMKIIDLSIVKDMEGEIGDLDRTISANEDARQASEASRESAEADRESAESSRALAEQTRNNRESVRQENELQRQYGEEYRGNQEYARREAENAREIAEDAREAAEDERAAHETARSSAESTRQVNENNRMAAESERHAQYTSDHSQASSDHSVASSDHSQAASDHETAVSDHSQASTDHTQASLDHTASETATSGAETVNVTIEGSIVTITNRNGVSVSTDIGFEIYKTYPSVASMNADANNVPHGKFVMIAATDTTSVDNAKMYVKNSIGGFSFISDLDQASSAAWSEWLNSMKPQIEAAITQAELDHTHANTDHGTAETDHTRAESDHSTAVSDHTTASSDHTTASEDHTQAVSDHTQASTDHATAQSDHSTAQNDHIQAGTDHEQAVSDSSRASSDHSTAQSDHAAASTDHANAASDHNIASSDHTRAENDHSTAANDHTQAEIDHSNAANDHTRAVEDHEQAVADHDMLATTVAQHTTQIAELQNIVADLETIAEGYVRVAGSSSPALSYKSYKYHEQGGFGRESVLSLFYPCLVGTKLTGNDAQVGKILHVLNKLDYDHDIYGNARTIDGSEGDVMICNIEPYYRIIGRHTIQGTEYDVFLMSRNPFTWQGIEAEKVDKFGWAPDFCVNHTDTDNVQRMHSVYNPEWNGSYNEPAGVTGKYVFSIDSETGDIVETYDENETLLGGACGLHTTDLALYDGEQRAMNQNPDTTKCVPFMNHTAAGCENMQALLLAEGGTFDAHNASLMGSGFSSNDGATAAADWEASGSGAKNGFRVKDKNDTWNYYGLNGNVRFLFGESTGTKYAANCINSWRNPFHIMEAHRAVSYAIQNGVHELEWFVFEGNKYKYRSVSGFNGPAQGEMTCVVWKLFATKAGSAAVDPTDGTTSIAGNRVEMLVSVALFHGMTTQVSPSWWTSGLIFTEDESQNYEAYMERDQESLIKSENGDIATSENFNFETLYKHVGSFTNGNGYRKNYSNDALMLPDSNANKSDGGLHTYVGAYNWLSGGAAPASRKSVRGFRRGVYANYTNLSLLAVSASSTPSGANAGNAFGTCVRIVD